MSHAPQPAGAYGTIDQFKDVNALVHAIEAARKAGYTKLDAYTPFPSHDVIHALDIPPSKLPWFVLGAGVTGGCLGFLLQYWVHNLAYPLNVGGRPLMSWPYFIPISYECTILFAAFTAAIGAFVLSGLPRPHHPTFSAKNFERASSDGFFLVVEAEDPKYGREDVEKLFGEHHALSIEELVH